MGEDSGVGVEGLAGDFRAGEWKRMPVRKELLLPGPPFPFPPRQNHRYRKS